MDALVIMLKNVVVFVLLAVPGYLLVKGKILKQADSGALSKLLTYVGMPFLILSSTLGVTFNKDFTKSILIVGVFGVVFTFGMFFLSALLTKGDKEEKRKGIMRFAMIFSNNGFLGIPLAQAVFGVTSEVVTYLIILNIITNIMMFTVGIYLISGDKRMISLKKAFLSPVLIAFIIGIILNLTKVMSRVPEITTYSNHFKNIVTPLSMLILGIKMADVNFKEMFGSWRTYYVSAIKLIALPVLSVGLAFLLKLVFAVNASMILAVFVAFSMPTAGLATAFSDQYDGDTKNAVSFTLGATLLSVDTIPVLYWLLTLLV
ncbi:MAG: AEC family transporter [Clostridia bacterium]|nr:AEC family transporter [Clostridia bacterium]